MLIYNMHIPDLKVIFMSVGTNIRKRRTELGMSQQELAQAMGYKTRSTIAKIESGENDVSQKKLQKFAAILDTTVESLISGYDSLPPALPREAYTGARRNRNVAVILAGGRDENHPQRIPAQFTSLYGKPVIIHSLEAYQAHPSIDDIYIVCARGWESIVKDYADQYGITKLRGLIPVGRSAVDSLKNTLDRVREFYSPEDYLVIQESTRPLVTTQTISQILQACAEKGSATICHSMKDYVQFNISGGAAAYVDRNAMIALQSPEAHRFSLLSEVMAKAEAQGHPLTETCCTMLLYNLGYEINFVESSINNVKVTYENTFSSMPKD